MDLAKYVMWPFQVVIGLIMIIGSLVGILVWKPIAMLTGWSLARKSANSGSGGLRAGLRKIGPP